MDLVNNLGIGSMVRDAVEVWTSWQRGPVLYRGPKSYCWGPLTHQYLLFGLSSITLQVERANPLKRGGEGNILSKGTAS